MQGDFGVSVVKRTNIAEIFFSENTPDDKYYKIKAAFISINEKTLAEKRRNVSYLVQAEKLVDALIAFDDYMKRDMIDCDIVSVSETAITDVFMSKFTE